ncbi:hypothetical protein MKZ38_008487 [Zalerion maritima]|uniref:Uncharacterized protein n=1 Tax=Zalerion maritima TaxID=339359 RepID=A0AAD5RVV8_9PEZI|nr:hypothetical protein MKZ38_008487 [Zalerion maritima]
MDFVEKHRTRKSGKPESGSNGGDGPSAGGKTFTTSTSYSPYNSCNGCISPAPVYDGSHQYVPLAAFESQRTGGGWNTEVELPPHLHYARARREEEMGVGAVKVRGERASPGDIDDRRQVDGGGEGPKNQGRSRVSEGSGVGNRSARGNGKEAASPDLGSGGPTFQIFAADFFGARSLPAATDAPMNLPSETFIKRGESNISGGGGKEVRYPLSYLPSSPNIRSSDIQTAGMTSSGSAYQKIRAAATPDMSTAREVGGGNGSATTGVQSNARSATGPVGWGYIVEERERPRKKRDKGWWTLLCCLSGGKY